MVLLALAAARLRWDRLGVSGLYLDDAWVAISTRVTGIGDLLRIGSTSPGFVLFGLRPWARWFGSTPTALQTLPFLLGVAAPPLCFAIARSWRVRFGPALLAAALLAVSPVHRTYSTSVKQYTAEAVATLLLLWAGARVIAEPGDRRRWTALMIGSVVATLLSVISAVVVLGILAATALMTVHREGTKTPRIAVLAIEGYGFFAVAWYATVLKPHLNSALYAFWHRDFIHLGDGIGTVPGQVLSRVLDVLSGFSALDPRLTLALIVVSAVGLMLGRPALGVMLLLPTGVAVVLAAGRVAPLGTGRTDIYLYPTLALVIGTGLDQLSRALPRRTGVPMSAAALVVACLVIVACRPVLTPYPAEDLQPLVRRIERERRADDVTIVYPMASFGYGMSTRSPVHIQADDRYAMSFFVVPDDPHTFVLPMERSTPSRYAPSIDRITSGRERVWLIGSHLWPDWNVVRSLLVARGFHVEVAQVTTRAMVLLYSRDLATLANRRIAG